MTPHQHLRAIETAAQLVAAAEKLPHTGLPRLRNALELAQNTPGMLDAERYALQLAVDELEAQRP